MRKEPFQEDDDIHVDGPEISCYNTGMLIVITTTNSTQFTASQRTSFYNIWHPNTFSYLPNKLPVT
jgi:hypothetical protein